MKWIQKNIQIQKNAVEDNRYQQCTCRSEKLMQYYTKSMFSILYMEIDHLILLYTNQVFPTTFIQFMVPGFKRFRQLETCLVKINQIVGKKHLEIMP